MHLLGHLDHANPDYAAAFKWSEKAAAQGSARAHTNLGILYMNGFHVQQDYAKAMELYLKHNGREDHVTAPMLIAIGDLYANGLGVAKNTETARYWYEKAAKTGSQEGADKLKANP